ncbi:protein cortex [Pieris rapae]|uniref:protein cortex n=1 Tax=Pieris rapae TaxID=64459 RepID=UPI000B928734|nr:protein cortex [Pieris rapae]
MDNYAFAKRSLNTRGQQNDRFICHREKLTEIRHCWRPHSPQKGNDILDLNDWTRRNYTRHLDNAFGLCKVKKEDVIKSWPCIPRRKSYLSSADNVLDLPTFSYADFSELLDWSSKDILVAALGSSYYKWRWNTQRISGRGSTNYTIQTCKFDPNGDRLAFGMTESSIQIHDTETNKHLVHKTCMCYFKNGCSVTSLDWSPTGNGLIVGCSLGEVTSYSYDLQIVAFFYKGPNYMPPIFCVRISPDARFAVIATLQSSEVYLVTWPFLQLHRVVAFQESIPTAMSWHPWCSALLCIGGVTNENHTQVVVCSVPNGKMQYTTLLGPYSLDAMLFSNKSGELVLSLYNTERGLQYPKISSRLVVLSDLSTVVDQWSDDGRIGLDRVRTMVSNPDGTKLATATLDEDLIIWNFLPETKEKTKSKRNLTSTAVYLDNLSGFSR